MIVQSTSHKSRKMCDDREAKLKADKLGVVKVTFTTDPITQKELE